jgi:hypothetical protein
VGSAAVITLDDGIESSLLLEHGVAEGREGGRAENGRSVNWAFIASTLCDEEAVVPAARSQPGDEFRRAKTGRGCSSTAM